MRHQDRNFDRRFAMWDRPFPPGRGGPPGFDRGRRGGGRRGRRGDVRAAVLALLVEKPMHGYEMIQELDSRTGGVWRPSPGSVYPTLQMLEDEGLIVSEQAEGRKQFTLTDAGREEATKAAERTPWAEFADQDQVTALRDFRDAVGGVVNAFSEVHSAGSDNQKSRAYAVLSEAKRKLYAILAEDDDEATR
ncbi:MAG TPA: PadR family transcriptional regulator [Acidimicrobiales bacterium]|nr:PadR family transcriptional regulator [Acidimicrobiales bacterium]